MSRNFDKEKKVHKINKPDVVFESFKDETVLINLKNGNYYSIDKVGTDILTFIEQCSTTDQIINYMKDRYNSTDHNIDLTVRKFITQLHDEKIIKKEESSSRENNFSGKKDSHSFKNSKKLSFSPPRLSKYTDMQELLLLDPIHDVDETGWPKKKPDETFNEE